MQQFLLNQTALLRTENTLTPIKELKNAGVVVLVYFVSEQTLSIKYELWIMYEDDNVPNSHLEPVSRRNKIKLNPNTTFMDQS